MSKAKVVSVSLDPASTVNVQLLGSWISAARSMVHPIWHSESWDEAQRVLAKLAEFTELVGNADCTITVDMLNKRKKCVRKLTVLSPRAAWLLVCNSESGTVSFLSTAYVAMLRDLASSGRFDGQSQSSNVNLYERYERAVARHVGTAGASGKKKPTYVVMTIEAPSTLVEDLLACCGYEATDVHEATCEFWRTLVFGVHGQISAEQEEDNEKDQVDLNSLAQDFGYDNWSDYQATLPVSLIALYLPGIVAWCLPPMIAGRCLPPIAARCLPG